MTKRIIPIIVMFAMAISAWADGTIVNTQNKWTFDEYSSQTADVFEYQGLFLQGGAAFETDSEHAASLSGTFNGTNETWEATKVLTVTEQATISFNYGIPGTLYVVFGAVTTDNGKFTVSQKKTGEAAYTTLIEMDMPGVTYDGPLNSRGRRTGEPYKFTLQQAKADLTETGTVVLGATAAYCVYAILFVPEQAVIPSTPVAYRFSDAFDKAETLTVDETAITIIENDGTKLQTRKDHHAITNNSEELPIDGRISWRIPNGKSSPELVSGGVKSNGYTFAIHNLEKGDQVTILYNSGTIKSNTSETTCTFSIDGTNVVAGDVIATKQVMTITSIDETNNYMVLAADSKTIIYGIYINEEAPTVITSLTTPAMVLNKVEGNTATYTVTYDEFATLHYILGKTGTEIIVNQPSPYDVTVGESDDITLWTTYETLKSEELKTVVFAPTPAPAVPGYIDFSFAKQLPADLTIELDETHTIQQDDITYYYPTAMTAATFDGKVTFTKTGEKKKIYLRKEKGTLTIAKGSDMELLFPGMKQNDMFSVTYSGTMTFANGETVESGKIYLMDSNTDLRVHLTLTSNSMAISKLTVSGVDVLTAPVIKDKNKNLIEITAGSSQKGLPVTTCYTTDGTDPSMTNGTSGPYDTFEVEVQDHNGIFEVRAISYTAEGTISEQSNLVIAVSNIPSVTGGVEPDDEVSEIDYEQPAPVITAEAVTYFISPKGSDENDGLSQQTAFATLGAAQALVKAGDIIYIMPGTYQVSATEIAREESSGPYKIVYDLAKSGTADKPISYIGILDDEGNRPVFDLSRVNPAGYRVTGFLITGNYLLLRNFEVVGIRVNITDHTQSENIRVSDGCHNTFENIACHDGMGIGFYLNKTAAYNLIVNCDCYNNYDYVSEDGAGDQNDGFGCHVKTDCPNNIFIGCRAWNNADDGFDLISCSSPVTFSYSIAYKNGYDAEGIARHDGNGFKAGGYGMSSAVTEVTEDNVPMHEVYNNLAVSNRSNGIYSNHHLGGIHFYNNTSYKNSRYNYSFINRKGFGDSADEMVDVDGYHHVIENNLSVTDTGKSNHVTGLNAEVGDNTMTNNSFVWTEEALWQNPNYGTSLFLSTKNSDLTAARDANGMLSKSTRSFMHQRYALGFGNTFDGYLEAIEAARRISGHGYSESSDTDTRGPITGVREMKDGSIPEGRYYNLQGVEVKTPTKGMYIYNGRKIFVK